MIKYLTLLLLLVGCLKQPKTVTENVCIEYVNSLEQVCRKNLLSIIPSFRCTSYEVKKCVTWKEVTKPNPVCIAKPKRCED